MLSASHIETRLGSIGTYWTDGLLAIYKIAWTLKGRVIEAFRHYNACLRALHVKNANRID